MAEHEPTDTPRDLAYEAELLELPDVTALKNNGDQASGEFKDRRYLVTKQQDGFETKY